MLHLDADFFERFFHGGQHIPVRFGCLLMQQERARLGQSHGAQRFDGVNADLRVGEAVRMGFERVILPYHNLSSVTPREGIELIGVRTVREAFEAIL